MLAAPVATDARAADAYAAWIRAVPSVPAYSAVPAVVSSVSWNEENRDYEVRRAQMYMVQGFILGNYILGVKTLVTMLYN